MIHTSIRLSVIRRISATMEEGEAKAVTMLLFEKLFGLSQTDVLMGKAEGLEAADVQRLNQCVDRICSGEPVQYVLGKADFMGMELKVSPAVLIPRPETEELVNEVLNAAADGKSLRILDIGTGSGCIALAIKKLLPKAEVTAWDISTEALRVARNNAEQLGLDICFEQRDILSTNLSVMSEVFDLIVSNPPYICRQESELMERRVTDFEPHAALFVPDDDPLLFYRAITRFASVALRAGGQLFFEINRRFGGQVCELMRREGFEGVTLKTDQFDNPRIVYGNHKEKNC
ncbi:MAG: peptide chain release factor N(5)-glutamine methyltransferase [Bacteroidaceae bacterium]